MIVILAPKDHSIATAMLAARRRYQAAVHGQSGHQHGDPAVGAFRALLLVLGGLVADEMANTVFADLLIELGDVVKWQLAAGQRAVRSAHRANTPKVDLSVAPLSLEDFKPIFVRAVSALAGVEVMLGRAPRSNLDRQVQGFVDKLDRKRD